VPWPHSLGPQFASLYAPGPPPESSSTLVCVVKAMKRSESRGIQLVAVLQLVPLALFPWSVSVGSLVAIFVLALLCGFLGWALFNRKPWGRTLTIFVQGFNIIVRIITLFANVYEAERGADVPLLVTYVASGVLSWLILSYIDRSEVQLTFQS